MFVKSQKISSAEDILEALVRFPCLSFEKEIINLRCSHSRSGAETGPSFSAGAGAEYLCRLRFLYSDFITQLPLLQNSIIQKQ